jgi:hypothetical protein
MGGSPNCHISGMARAEARKQFFFEKKNQKTFTNASGKS